MIVIASSKKLFFLISNKEMPGDQHVEQHLYSYSKFKILKPFSTRVKIDCKSSKFFT